MISERSQNVFIFDTVFIIQRDAVNVFGLKRLKDIHVVGHRRCFGCSLRIEIVPTRPSSSADRQYVMLSVKFGDVLFVGERRKDLLLILGRICTQQRKRLIAMATKHDMIKLQTFSSDRLKLNLRFAR